MGAFWIIFRIAIKDRGFARFTRSIFHHSTTGKHPIARFERRGRDLLGRLCSERHPSITPDHR